MSTVVDSDSGAWVNFLYVYWRGVSANQKTIKQLNTQPHTHTHQSSERKEEGKKKKKNDINDNSNNDSQLIKLYIFIEIGLVDFEWFWWGRCTVCDDSIDTFWFISHMCVLNRTCHAIWQNQIHVLNCIIIHYIIIIIIFVCTIYWRAKQHQLPFGRVHRMKSNLFEFV